MEATHIYCSNCEAIQRAEFEPLIFEDDTGSYLGGDALCTVCRLIIATLYRPKQDKQVTALSLDGRLADGSLL
jgi:hypothetical protein